MQPTPMDRHLQLLKNLNGLNRRLSEISTLHYEYINFEKDSAGSIRSSPIPESDTKVTVADVGRSAMHFFGLKRNTREVRVRLADDIRIRLFEIYTNFSSYTASLVGLRKPNAGANPKVVAAYENVIIEYVRMHKQLLELREDIRIFRADAEKKDDAANDALKA